jgi:arginine decarboxylase
MPKRPPIRYSEIGCRIPKEYFWVIGWGESSVGIETGSYDAALHMAGIENYNLMLYTSVLPPEAVELRHLPDIHHGSVLEGIIAVQHTDKPRTRITVGVLLAKVYRNADNSYLGGFACEYAGNGSPKKRNRICGKQCSTLALRHPSPWAEQQTRHGLNHLIVYFTWDLSLWEGVTSTSAFSIGTRYWAMRTIVHCSSFAVPERNSEYDRNSTVNPANKPANGIRQKAHS